MNTTGKRAFAISSDYFDGSLRASNHRFADSRVMGDEDTQSLCLSKYGNIENEHSSPLSYPMSMGGDNYLFGGTDTGRRFSRASGVNWQAREYYDRNKLSCSSPTKMELRNQVIDGDKTGVMMYSQDNQEPARFLLEPKSPLSCPAVTLRGYQRQRRHYVEVMANISESSVVNEQPSQNDEYSPLPDDRKDDAVEARRGGSPNSSHDTDHMGHSKRVVKPSNESNALFDNDGRTQIMARALKRAKQASLVRKDPIRSSPPVLRPPRLQKSRALIVGCSLRKGESSSSPGVSGVRNDINTWLRFVVQSVGWNPTTIKVLADFDVGEPVKSATRKVSRKTMTTSEKQKNRTKACVAHDDGGENRESEKQNSQQHFGGWHSVGRPTKQNIMKALDWLKAGTLPNEYNTFIFCGFSVDCRSSSLDNNTNKHRSRTTFMVPELVKLK